MANPLDKIRARSRYLQVRSGPAGNRAMGYNPAVSLHPINRAANRIVRPVTPPTSNNAVNNLQNALSPITRLFR